MRSRPPAEVRPEGQVRDAFSCPGKANEDSTVEGWGGELSRIPPILGECQALPDGLKQDPGPEPGRALCSIPDPLPGLAWPFLSIEPHLVALRSSSPGQVWLCAASLSAVPTWGIPWWIFLIPQTSHRQRSQRGLGLRKTSTLPRDLDKIMSRILLEDGPMEKCPFSPQTREGEGGRELERETETERETQTCGRETETQIEGERQK